MKDVLLDTLLDSAKLLPFLFFAFLIIEWLERKLNKKTEKAISKSGKLGPIFGSALGIIPQCGFGVVATNLYITRIITLGTLFSVYLSTSDEMLPVLLSEKAPIDLIIKILAIKFAVGIIYGFIIDFVLCRKEKIKIHELCDDEHCHCEEDGILKSSVIHTLKTIAFIFVITFILNTLFEFYGEAYLSKIFLKDSLFAPFVSSLIGLIPNCGASVMITELYLNGAFSFATLIGGLLTGSGISLIVLFKSNKNLKENLFIVLTLYLLGAITGVAIELIMMCI